MKIGLFVVSLLIGALVIPVAFAIDFEGHTQFTNVELQGDFRVTCSNGREFNQANHQCLGYLLNPIGSFARVTDDSGIDADRIELQTTRKDSGRVITKKSNWNASEGRSTKNINLWVWTVFQRPLLEMGDNEVRYAYTKRGQRVSGGSFFVNVSQGETRTCQHWSHRTSDMRMCDSSGIACSYYFDRQNNCQ